MAGASRFVLVHGAWGGAHTWRAVRPLLWQAGHEVITPSLTGIGERAHLTGPHVDLSVHIEDVVNAVLYEDATEIVLVGFSYGGMVVTGALAHIADRVRELVYLDAFVPADGEALVDLTGAAGQRGQRPTITLGDAWLVPPRDRDFDDPSEAAFAKQRRTPQPARTFTEHVHLPMVLESTRSDEPTSRRSVTPAARPAATRFGTQQTDTATTPPGATSSTRATT